MDPQQRFADPVAGSGMVRAYHLAPRSVAPPSILFGRVCVALLAAPWLFVLLQAALPSWPGLPQSAPLWVALALFTLAGITVSSDLLRRARKYESRCGNERLLFANARDPMLLIRVLRNPKDPSLPLEFILKAQNPAATQQLKHFDEEARYINQNITAFFPDWLVERVQHEYTACVTTGEIRRYEICAPDGSRAHESVATPVFDATGTQVTHIVVIMRDIAERVQHERRLADAVREAEAASKSKSQFLASMSHELRTPLNAVLGYSELLSLGIGGALSDKHKEYAQYIHQSGSHLLNIIGDILDLSKIEAGQFVLHEEVTPIPPLIDSCVFMVRERLVGKGLRLDIKLPSGLPLFRVDPLRLKQVVLNLLSNAIKFTEAGTITVTAQFDESEGLRLAVSDTGIGMTEAETALALEPFGQVQSAFARNHEGTGLGLPIARHLMDLHGGRLSVESRKHSGTTVSIILPPDRLVTGARTLTA